MANYTDLIYDNIVNEKCVVLIGNDLITQPNNQSLHKAFIAEMQKKNTYNIHYDYDDLAIFDSSSNDKNFYSIDLKKYYTTHAQPIELHQKIAQIPFHLILCTSPDLAMKSVFENFGIKHTFDFYNKTQNPKAVETPNAKNPLLYNLFGSVNEEDSLIITNDDLLDFIFAILGDKKLPLDLQHSLRGTKSFLFLGFDLEKWYMKIIFRLFNLPKQAIPFAQETSVRQEVTKNFFINNFKMQFIKEDSTEIIEQLFVECQKAGILREIKQLTENPVATQVRQLVKDDDLEKALITLEDYLDGKNDELFNAVILHSGTYKRLQRNIDKGTVYKEDASVQLAKIRDAILGICSEIQKM